MMNLFSSFDPTTSPNTSMNWLSLIMPIMIVPSMYWMTPSRLNLLWNKILISINNEFKILLKTEMKKSTSMFIALFSFIMTTNISSLFPYVFASTSHVVITLSMALPLWFSFMIYGWLNETTNMLSHMVPMGTPPILMPFMVCIESISNIIRPMTLTIRLAANLIAGHLLMTLLGTSATMMSQWMIGLVISIQILLIILESAVSIIQAYVFSILMTLYSSEIN